MRFAAAHTSIPAQAYALWGDILLDAGRLDEAEEKYRRATTADQTLADGLAGLARLRLQQGQYDEASQLAEEAVDRDPFPQTAWANWAESYRLAYCYDDAIAKYQELLSKIDPYYSSAYVGWGQVLRSKHQLHEAVYKFRHATKIDETDSWAWRSWGEALLDMHRYEAAIDKFCKPLEINPWDAWAHHGWGNALAALGRLDEALSEFRRACELDGRNFWARCRPRKYADRPWPPR